MPNMSNKNFPHAHGSGRVFAAFSLSHLAGTPGSFDEEYLPGASEMLTKPPAFTDPLLPIAYPFPGVITSGPTQTFNIQRQPYNATSLGVFVTGSGTRRLPYREALGLFVPNGVSPTLAQTWPNNDLYPFALVDETNLGSTHGQVVCGVTGSVEAPDLGDLAYYEVGLNWELPPYKTTIDFGSAEVTASNWEHTAIASFQRALERTFWVTASVSGNALSEYHPEVDWGPGGVQTANSAGGPVSGSLSLGVPPPADSYYSAPYAALTAPALTPYRFPWSAGESEAFRQRPAIVQTQLSAVVTSISQTELPSGEYDSVIKAAPVIRVWFSVPVAPVAPGGSPMVAPRPLPRGGVNPYLNDPADLPKLPPAINVQVMQKNTTAIDSTDGPIYDLGQRWDNLGVPSAAASRATAPKLSGPPLKASKKKDSK